MAEWMHSSSVLNLGTGIRNFNTLKTTTPALDPGPVPTTSQPHTLFPESILILPTYLTVSFQISASPLKFRMHFSSAHPGYIYTSGLTQPSTFLCSTNTRLPVKTQAIPNSPLILQSLCPNACRSTMP